MSQLTISTMNLMPKNVDIFVLFALLGRGVLFASLVPMTTIADDINDAI